MPAESASFDDLLEQYGIEHSTEGRNTRPGWTQLDCPYCGGHEYLGFNRVGNYLNCWRCGPRQVIETLHRLTSLPYGKLKSIVGSFERDRTISEPKRGKLVLPDGVGSLRKAHKKYLRSRGYDPDTLAALWSIQGTGPYGRLKWRLYIPISFRQETVSWTTRAITDAGSRYISAGPSQEIFNHKELLYGEDYARHTIIIVEGPTDVWRIGPGAVATLGTGYKRAQLVRMAMFPVRVVCFDNEPKAQRRARELADLLSLYEGETYNVTLSGKDASSTDPKEIRKLRKRFLHD